MTRHPLVLATDLDGTLVGDAAAMRELNDALSRQRDRIRLIYATGRSLGSVLRLIEGQGLLTPDWIIAGVGTSIHRGPTWAAEPMWARQLGQQWSAERVRAIASFFPVLTPQSPENQGAFKCSYTLAAEHAAATMESLADTLRIHRISARLIYSSNRDLDVLPARSGKGNAIRYLAKQQRIPLAHILTCGDSGNDREMLELGGPSAIVANAQPELQADAPEAAYRCRAPYAAGILEALAHFGWAPSRLAAKEGA